MLKISLEYLKFKCLICHQHTKATHGLYTYTNPNSELFLISRLTKVNVVTVGSNHQNFIIAASDYESGLWFDITWCNTQQEKWLVWMTNEKWRFTGFYAKFLNFNTNVTSYSPTMLRYLIVLLQIKDVWRQNMTRTVKGMCLHLWPRQTSWYYHHILSTYTAKHMNTKSLLNSTVQLHGRMLESINTDFPSENTAFV